MEIEIVDYNDNEYTAAVSFDQEPVYTCFTMDLSSLYLLKEVVKHAIAELEKRVSEEKNK